MPHRMRLDTIKLVAAAMGLGAITFALRYLAFASFSNDHFQHLARAQQLLLGALPVRDFAESGIPMTTALSAAAQLIFGRGLHAEVLWIALAFAMAAAIAVPIAVRASGSLLLGLAGAGLTVVAVPATYSYPKVFAYVITFAVVAWYAARPSTRRLLLLAASVVMAFLMRYDHGAILAIGVLAALVAIHQPVFSAMRVAARFAVMGLVLVSPYLVWVQAYEGLDVHISEGRKRSQREFEKASWDRPAFSLDRTRPLVEPLLQGPVVEVQWVAGLPAPYRIAKERAFHLEAVESSGPQSWRYHLQRWTSSAVQAIVQDPTVADTDGIDRSTFRVTAPGPGAYLQPLAWLPSPGEGLRTVENGIAVLYCAAWLLPVFALPIAWRSWSQLSPPARGLIVMGIAVQLLMDWFMLRDPLRTRVRDVIAPLAVLLPFVAARLWQWSPRRGVRIAVRAAIVVGLSVTLWAGAAVGNLSEEVENAELLNGWQAISGRYAGVRDDFAPPHERTGRVELPIVDYLRDCSVPTARIFMMTFAPELLFYTGRGFAGGHESIMAGMQDTPRQIALMLSRLEGENVPFVILDSETEAEMPMDYPPVSAYVQRHYREVARFPVSGMKQWVVLATTDRLPLRTYGEQALPCFAKSSGV